MNTWVYDQTKALLDRGKLVGLLGGDHSAALGFFKAIGEKHGDYGILQIDAHCDLRDAYTGFNYSHVSVMNNALNEIPEIKKLVQVGARDFSPAEWEYVKTSNNRIVTFFDADIKKRQYEGDTWKNIADEIVKSLPKKYLSVLILMDLTENFARIQEPRYPVVLRRKKYFIFFVK
ncbi:MAG: arginase family protein [Chitinophagaceae bacterium]